ncbi:MAG: hypothetical protein ACTHMW_05800 [Actinomycetes bacterium]
MPKLRLRPDLEDGFRQLQGVRGVSVVTDGHANPTEIHVLASMEKSAKQLARDVQSFALAQYGLEIDHRIISVVQLGEDEDAVASPLSPDLPVSRPWISSITVQTRGDEATVTVTVAAAGEVFEGTASGSHLVSQRPRLVASATLDALAELLGRPCDLEEAQVVPIGKHRAALVLVSLAVPRSGEHSLVGTALVRGDEADAFARAVLDALNRQLTA